MNTDKQFCFIRVHPRLPAFIGGHILFSTAGEAQGDVCAVSPLSSAPTIDIL
jgi:hypothetical protein